MKKCMFVLLTFAILLHPAGWITAETGISVMLDSRPVSFLDGATPYLDENERTMVPVNEIALAMGTKKTWNNQEKSAIFLKGENKIVFTVDSEKYIINNADYPMDTSAVLVGDKMFVPVRYLAEGFGLTVAWDMPTQTVSLQSPGWPASFENLHFEQNLLETLPDHENYIVSPMSLSMAMTMVANGTTGETQSEILNTLGIADLTAQNKQNQTILQNKEQTLKLANSIWINQGYYPNWPVDFSPAFKENIQQYYGGTACAIPKQNGAEVINQWVCEHTDRQIEHILKQEDWEEFLSVIVNTISFRDEWEAPFEARYTANAPFYTPNGEMEKEFMAQTAQFPYFEDELCQAVALPYKHGDISIVLILPQSQEKPILQKVIDGLQTKKVFVKLPKFEVKSQLDATELFQTLGIKRAFQDNNPDFSEMYVNLPLTAKVKKILHHAFIKVDEAGTEAAAATVVGGAGGSAMAEPPIQFEVNRPFYLLVYDKSLGKVLMMGRYVQ